MIRRVTRRVRISHHRQPVKSRTKSLVIQQICELQIVSVPQIQYAVWNLCPSRESIPAFSFSANLLWLFGCIDGFKEMSIDVRNDQSILLITQGSNWRNDIAISSVRYTACTLIDEPKHKTQRSVQRSARVPQDSHRDLFESFEAQTGCGDDESHHKTDLVWTLKGAYYPQV